MQISESDFEYSWIWHMQNWQKPDPLRDLRPRKLPSVSAFIAGNPYIEKKRYEVKLMEFA
ncbi:MAG: hypothetical protein KGL39_40010 [Patescibacteria group bacterium]|nr:hypothetical protein [Patescibacteria group bacterium]